MQTVTIANQKGGVGKTTIAHALSCGLSCRGFNVLALDLDPQMNFTMAAGITPGQNDIDMHDLFNAGGGLPSLQAVTHTQAGFDIIPGSMQFAGADKEYINMGREYILKEIITPLNEKYDYCIIDTPPTLGILSINALTASNGVIVPMGTDIFSLQGLSQLQGVINNVRKYCNPGLKINGLIVNKYDSRGVINRNLKESLTDLAAKLETRLYDTTIREAVVMKEVQFLQANIFTEYPKANITNDLNLFIDEFLRKDA